MCGIAGKLLLSKKNEIDSNIRKSEINKMLTAINHRGPDDEGIYIDDSIAMGMKRLSILDLEFGTQPIYNENRTVSVVFNGEIYNYIELRAELEKKGHIFYTQSDTEVLVHLYEEYGDNFSGFLNGMFAYSLWDSVCQKLIISRDRVGEKPLYYTEQNRVFSFCSEIKGLLTDDKLIKKVNYEAINALISFNYIPYPLTGFEGIRRLSPGTTLIIDTEGKKIIKYWEIPTTSKNHNSINLQKQIDKLIDDSTKIRLRSDVEVAAFLSGGIDSTVVTKYIKNHCERKFKTFSIGFDQLEYSELKYAKEVSKKYNTDQIIKIVDQDNFLDEIINTIWFCENPHGDVSFAPTYVVSKLASEYVKVVLTGDGGDEIFGGYEKYTNFVFNNSKSENENFKDYLEATSVFDLKFKKDVLEQDFYDKFGYRDPYEEICLRYQNIHEGDIINKMLYFDTEYLLEGNNLVKPDRMGMANSIEGRYPLLDHRIIDLMFTVNSELKIVNGEKKYLLKNLLRGDFKDEFINRKKQMFTVPIGEWFKNKNFYELTKKIFKSKSFESRELFKPQEALSMLEDHFNDKANYTRELRLMLIVELWHRIFIDSNYIEKPNIRDILKEV